MLRVKHWQLFLLFIFLYYLGVRLHRAAPIADLTSQLMFLAWMTALKVQGQKQLGLMAMRKSGTRIFGFNITYLAVLLILVSIFKMQHQYNYSGYEGHSIWWFVWAYAFYAAAQTVWFTARTLADVENGGEYSWGTSVVYCFFILIPPVGIWVIQPTANKWIQA